MKEKRDKISFWLTVVSFIGSVIFIANVLLSEKHQSTECKNCIERLLYYQHRADSLQQRIEQGY